MPENVCVPVKVTCTGLEDAKVAVTVELPARENEQLPVPVQLPPLQPVNVLPAAGVAVQEIAVP